MSMKIESPAFKEGGMIPEKYTCDGENISPPVNWSNIPRDTRYLAIIMDDPDAPSGDFVHWIIYNISAETHGLQEGITSTRNLPDSAMLGTNSYHSISYMGPCPPSGTHRYQLKLYALDTILQMDSGANKGELLEAMEGHIIGQAMLTGKFARKS